MFTLDSTAAKTFFILILRFAKWSDLDQDLIP